VLRKQECIILTILKGITTDTATGLHIGVPGTRIVVVTMTDTGGGIACDVEAGISARIEKRKNHS
jgi:hypothetical protein